MLLSGGRFLRAIEQLAAGLEVHAAHSTYGAMA